jgi:hypothetical protein
MSNPLLFKVKLPGRIFQLPSKGLFYKQGVLADHVKDGEIHVHPMSALGELKLRSPDLLFSGRALREVVEECIPDIKNPTELISKDVDAIFCFLRIVTYGSEMTIKSIHDCENAKVHTYSVNIEQIITVPNNKSLEHRDMLYKLKLENGQTVNLRPITFQDSIDIIQLRQEIEKIGFDSGQPDSGLLESLIVRDVLSAIESVTIDVEGKPVTIDDRNKIDEWIRSLQKTFIDQIIAQSQKSSEWGFNLNVDIVCKDCGKKYQHDLELDPINFFSG